MTVADGVIRVAAAVILDADNRVLVVRKRGTSSFMQPGGKIEPGESALDALGREVREELGTGFDLATARALGRHAAAAANEAHHVVDAELFLVHLDGDPHPAAEIAALAWVDPDACGHLQLAPLTEQTVLAWVREALN